MVYNDLWILKKQETITEIAEVPPEVCAMKYWLIVTSPENFKR